MNVSDSDKRDPFEPRLQDPFEPRLTAVEQELKLLKQKEDEARINKELEKLDAPFILKVYWAER